MTSPSPMPALPADVRDDILALCRAIERVRVVGKDSLAEATWILAMDRVARHVGIILTVKE